MAPKKAPAVPKKTVEEVEAEYRAKQAASAERIAVLKQQLDVEKSKCEKARLDLVAARENRVYLDARVASEADSNQHFESDAKQHLDELNKALKQLKRSSKDKGYELNYVRDVAAGVERELEIIQNSIAQLEADCRLNPRELERELDRLAQSVVSLESDRTRLLRTIAAIKRGLGRMFRVAPATSLRMTDCTLQLTLIGSSGIGGDLAADSVRHCFCPPPRHSVLSSLNVLERLESALVSQCGFEVIERITPHHSVVIDQLTALQSEQGLRRRVEEALLQASESLAATPAVSLVVMHCPSKVRPVAGPDGSPTDQSEIVLLISQLSDESKAFMRETLSSNHHVDPDCLATAEIPLSTVLSILVSRGKGGNVSVLIDTWPAPLPQDPHLCNLSATGALEDRSPSVAFCLFWNPASMSVPLVFQYRGLFDPECVSYFHSAAGRLGSHNTPRGLMIESLTAIVECSPVPHLLDGYTVSKALDSMLVKAQKQTTSPLLKIDGKNSAVGTPFAALFFDVGHLRRMFHEMPVSLRPLASPFPIHVEKREEQVVARPQGSEVKWRRRLAASLSPAQGSFRKSQGKLPLLQRFAEQTAGTPHTRMCIDFAIEDPEYHVETEDVEDLALEKVVNVSEDPSASSNHVNQVRLSVKRPRTLRDDAEEWAALVTRRLQSALISADEQQKTLTNVLHLKASKGDQDNDAGIHTLLPTSLASSGEKAFGVAVAPLPLDVADVESLSHVKWFIEGKRCPDRTVQLEIMLVVDVKKGAEFEHFAHVTQAKDALAHSLKRSLDAIAESVDQERPVDLILQVAYHIECFRCGGPKDDAHFVATIRVAAILSERCIGTICPSQTSTHTIVGTSTSPLDINKMIAVRWIRCQLTKRLKRWEMRGGHEWLPLAEATPDRHESVFRVVRLLHVVRNWSCNISLHESTPPHQVQQRVQWVEHLVKSLLLWDGGVAGAASVVASSPGALFRILDLRSLPAFIGISKGLLSGGDDDIFGPNSRINRMNEIEIAHALAKAMPCNAREPTSQSPNSIAAIDRSLCATFSIPPSAPQYDCLTLLVWLVPQSFLNLVQRSQSTGQSIIAEHTYTLQSLQKQYHQQIRVSAEGSNRRFLVLCSTMEYDDSRTATEAFFQNPHVVKSSAVLEREMKLQEEILLSFTAKESVSPAVGLMKLPLQEIGVNHDDGDGSGEGGATPRDQDHQGGGVGFQKAIHSTVEAQAAAGDNDVECDETFRHLGGDCLRSQSAYTADPFGALFSLPLRALHEVFAITQVRRAEFLAKHECPHPLVHLLGISWSSSQQPYVKLMTSSDPELQRTLSPQRQRTLAESPDGETALKGQTVDLFLQEIINTPW